jgi:phenylacetate-CoA ligase
VRIGRIMARSDDMLIIRGVNVYPSQVEHALLQVPELAPHYLLVVRREHALDTLEVRVEALPAAATAGEAAVGALARVRRRLMETLGLSAEVSIVAPKAIERSAGKAQRVLDLRTQTG